MLLMELFVIHPRGTLVCGFHALFDPLDALCAGFDIRIPEVAVSALVGLSHSDCEACIQVAPRLEQTFGMAAADFMKMKMA